jgi:type 1 glutamine amidotransferase
VVWLNDSPQQPAQRQIFQQYMEHGGAWMGFHFAGYNDESTHWPWFTGDFLDAVFFTNNWPPLPATLVVEDRDSPVTRGLPATYISPANEWYIWKPDPRANKNIHVLLSLSPSNYPLGMKDTLTAGDLPVVWTNTKYKMLYCNMGHGDKIFTSDTQNQLFRNAILWLGESQTK